MFSFECPIPVNCPSSFEDSDGHIRYQIKIVVDRAFKLDQEKMALFRIVAPVDLNLIPSVRVSTRDMLVNVIQEKCV